MRVLYITGACLTKNTSANMSHNAFVKGLIDNNCIVDIIMAGDSWGNEDSVLQRFDKANYYTFNSQSFADKLRSSSQNIGNNSESVESTKCEVPRKKRLNKRAVLKKIFYIVFPKDKLYPLEKKWLKTASMFKSREEYDLVISNSSPAASHKLVVLLKEKRNIKYKHWVQIWEDPWYYDLYGGHTKCEKEEEHLLLRQASEVYYVSPLTFMYQKQYYSDCASKMKCVPLPYLEYEKERYGQLIKNSFGYFGDYYSVTRNLKPFYNALKESGYKGFIYGDNDLNLWATENIEVSGRVTLDVLSKIQNKTQILVHLCNLKGGQIPGKIYHYSATAKPILFILDGTDEEKKILQDFFEKYSRYYFCENNKDDILKTMKKIISEKKAFEPVTDFSPKEVVRRIIENETKTTFY